MPKPLTDRAPRRRILGRDVWAVGAVALESVVALAVFTALAVWLTWDVAAHLHDRMFGYPGDSTGAVSLLDWFSGRLGYHVFGTTHETWIGAPFGNDYPNGLNIQWLLVFGPGALLAKAFGEVAAYNLLVISGLALSGVSMYLVVRVLGCAPPVAAWSGLVYTIFPWHIEKAEGHVGFVHLQLFPLLLLAGLAWYRKPTAGRAIALATVTLLLWLTAGYFGVVGSVSAATLVTVALALHSRRLGLRAALGKYVLAGSLVVAVPVLVYAATIVGNANGVGSPRSAADLFVYGARPWEYVLPSYRNPYFGDDVGPFLIRHLHGSNFSETSLYVGWLTILLALVWLGNIVVRRGRLALEESFLAVALPAIVAVALVFSLPSPLPHTHVETPSQILWQLAPQFRVPSRFVSVVMTGLVVAAAFGLTLVARRAARTLRLASPIVVVAFGAAAAAVSFVELYVKTSPSTFDVSTPPAYYSIVEKAPRGILAEYPLARADQAVNSDYLFWQRIHHRRLLNGAQIGSFPDQVAQSLVDPASPETPSALAALGVTAIVTRPSTYQFTGGAPGAVVLGRGYRKLGEAQGAAVWQVVARPAPAIAAFKDGFGPIETPPGSRAGRWLNADRGTVDLYAWQAGTYQARFQVSSFGRPRVVRIGGDHDFELVRVPTERTVDVRLRLPRGHSHLVLDVRPGAEPIPDGRIVSIHVGNWQIGAVEGGTRADALEPLPGESS
jgi:hypothetical protein